MSQGKIVLMACGSFSPPTPMHLRMFEIARDYINSLGTQTVIGGIISPVHDAYGKKGLISATHRQAMLKLALSTSDWIKVSDWEINQEGWTRTKDTLQHHQNQINNFMKTGPFNNRDLPNWLPNEILNRVLNNYNYDTIDNLPQMCANLRNSINDNNMNNQNNGGEHVQLKLLCGADLLESFATPGLWSEDDVETILGNHGLVVVTRSGANPEKFIHDSDLLTKFRRNLTIVTNWVPNEVSSTVIRRLLRRGESVKYLIDDVLISYIKQHQLFGVVDNKEAMKEKLHAFSSS